MVLKFGMVVRPEEFAAVRKSLMPSSGSVKSQYLTRRERENFEQSFKSDEANQGTYVNVLPEPALHETCTAKRVSPEQGAPPKVSSLLGIVHEALPRQSEDTTSAALGASQLADFVREPQKPEGVP